MASIKGEEAQDMVGHWLSVPVNGYLGSGYGSDPQSLLQKPMLSGLGDAFVQKMRIDVPILGVMPSGDVDTYFEERGNDSKNLIIRVRDKLVTVNSSGEVI